KCELIADAGRSVPAAVGGVLPHQAAILPGVRQACLNLPRVSCVATFGVLVRAEVRDAGAGVIADCRRPAVVAGTLPARGRPTVTGALPDSTAIGVGHARFQDVARTLRLAGRAELCVAHVTRCHRAVVTAAEGITVG